MDSTANRTRAAAPDTDAVDAAPGVVRMYTTRWCGDCVVTKNFLGKFGVDFEEIDIEADPAAAEYVMSVNGGRRSVPTLVYGDDAVSLSGFTRAKLDAFLERHELR